MKIICKTLPHAFYWLQKKVQVRTVLVKVQARGGLGQGGCRIYLPQIVLRPEGVQLNKVIVYVAKNNNHVIIKIMMQIHG